MGFWGKCRTTFRWCRITAWLLVLVVLCAGIYCNRVGLPDFLKQRIIATLDKSGVKLEFSRMRLSLIRGVVADNVHVGAGQDSTNSALTAREVQLQLDFHALLHRRLQLDGLTVRDGTFTLIASPTNELILTNLQTELRFQTNDTWTLDHFRANFDGTRINVSGEVEHAPEIRNWEIFRSQKSGGQSSTNNLPAVNRSVLAPLLQEISGPFARIHFNGAPRLDLTINGDARDIHSIALKLDADVPDVQTPWFSARGLRLSTQLTAPANALTNLDVAQGFWTNLQPFRLEWLAHATVLRVENLEAETLSVGGEWHAPQLLIKNFSAQLATGNVVTSMQLDVATRALTFTNDSSFDPHLLADWLTQKAHDQLAKIVWTQSPILHLGGSLTLPPWTNAATNWREEIAPTVRLNGALAFTNAVILNTTLDSLQTHFSYARQFWDLSGFELMQGRTQLKFDGAADETAQNFYGRLRGALEATSARPFLTASNLTRNFELFHFHEPLVLDVAVRGNWRDWNTLEVTGSGALTNFSMTISPSNELAVDFLRTHFSYTNQFWKLSALELAQNGTRLQFDGETSDATENFTGQLRGAFDPESIRPFLPTQKAVNAFEIVKCNEPVRLNVTATGNWHDLSSLTATGSVAVTNFSVRAQVADSVTANFFYTNRWLDFFKAQLFRAGGTQTLTADTVALDFPDGRLYITNGFSTTDPMFVVRCIGPKTAKQIEPYHFPQPPTATVNGCSPLRDVKNGYDLHDADLTFVILKPTPFRWSRLQSSGMTGIIRWRGQYLDLTNIAGEFYGGTATGGANFDFTPHSHDADFQFAVTVTNVDLHQLMTGLSDPTNKLAGRLSGSLAVTNASTETLSSWNGYGAVRLHNGLLWNTPIFGLASDALNLFMPGLGNSQATDASMTFGLTNGVIRSDSLEMHTATMRLQYNGTVDLTGNVNARVTAQLLRNAPLIGQLASTILWPVSKIFECQVTGQLSNPKITPIYVPFSKILFSPLHPVRSFEEMFVEPNSPTE